MECPWYEIVFFLTKTHIKLDRELLLKKGSIQEKVERNSVFFCTKTYIKLDHELLKRGPIQEKVERNSFLMYKNFYKT